MELQVLQATLANGPEQLRQRSSARRVCHCGSCSRLLARSHSKEMLTEIHRYSFHCRAAGKGSKGNSYRVGSVCQAGSPNARWYSRRLHFHYNVGERLILIWYLKKDTRLTFSMIPYLVLKKVSTRLIMSINSSKCSSQFVNIVSQLCTLCGSAHSNWHYFRNVFCSDPITTCL